MAKIKRKQKSKRKPKARSVKAKPRAIPAVVHKVDLHPTAVLRVAIPPGAAPLILSDPVKRELVIAPAPKKEGFWGSLFSGK